MDAFSVTDDRDDAQGVECARLLELLRDPRFAPVTLPVHPLDARDAHCYLERFFDPRDDRDRLVTGYTEYLRKRRPDLADRVHAACGGPPWSIRPADEAGVRDGVLRATVSDVHGAVAATVWSGWEGPAGPRPFPGPEPRPRPFPVLAQPLIEDTSEPAATPDEAPMPGAADLAALTGRLAGLHVRFGPAGLRTGWVLRTDAGIVSVTGLTTMDAGGRVVGRLGFRFGSLVAVPRRGNTAGGLVWLTGVPGVTLKRGAPLRGIRIDAVFLARLGPAV